MSQVTAHEIVENALLAGRVDALLLERAPYTFLPRWSCATGASDVIALLDSLYGDTFSLSKDEIRDALANALFCLVRTYEGLTAVATCIMVESCCASDGHCTLGLPLASLANELKASIHRFGSRLVADKSGDGSQFPDGLFGELRRLNKITLNLGGPGFFDDRARSGS